MDVRKREEMEFHDQLRAQSFEQRWSTEAEANTQHDPRWSNFKYYAVERRSLAHVRNWLMANCPGRRVLDIGCGNGEESLLVAKYGARQVVGIDLSEVTIRNCRERARAEGVAERTDFRVMDIERLEFADDSFDVIMEYGVLHHVDLDQAMRELARVLKPDGAIICTETVGHNLLIQAYRRLTPGLRTKWEVEHILRKKDFGIIRRYFDGCNTRFFHLATLAAVPFRHFPGFRVLLGFLEFIDSLLLRIPLLRWQAWQMVFVLTVPKKTAASPSGTSATVVAGRES